VGELAASRTMFRDSSGLEGASDRWGLSEGAPRLKNVVVCTTLDAALALLVLLGTLGAHRLGETTLMDTMLG
jgi:hypothetical protein